MAPTVNHGGKPTRWLYFLAAGVAIFSGMGQMPVLKRYYVTDLPLMGWAENFFTLSHLHYLAAALLLLLLAYRLAASPGLATGRWSWGPGTAWGWTLLALLIASGAFKAARNTGVYLDPVFIMVLDFVHLGSAMAFMFTGLFALILRRRGRARGREASLAAHSAQRA
jgi:hypothetical protein